MTVNAPARPARSVRSVSSARPAAARPGPLPVPE